MSKRWQLNTTDFGLAKCGLEGLASGRLRLIMNSLEQRDGKNSDEDTQLPLGKQS
jgi:hypothetical protein